MKLQTHGDCENTATCMQAVRATCMCYTTNIPRQDYIRVPTPSRAVLLPSKSNLKHAMYKGTWQPSTYLATTLRSALHGKEAGKAMCQRNPVWQRHIKPHLIAYGTHCTRAPCCCMRFRILHNSRPVCSFIVSGNGETTTLTNRRRHNTRMAKGQKETDKETPTLLCTGNASAFIACALLQHTTAALLPMATAVQQQQLKAGAPVLDQGVKLWKHGALLLWLSTTLPCTHAQSS